MEILPMLPPLQAILNFVALGLVVLAYYSIRKKNRPAHRAFMTGALLVSGLFLVSYVAYHQNVGYVPFAGEGVIRPLFFGILITHIVAAAAIIPLVLTTVAYALRGQHVKHRRIARWAFPLWVYTSGTGIIVYLFVFQFYPPP
jgi:putative membrane protein